MNITIGMRLKKIREHSNNSTVQEFAEILNLDAKYIESVENDKSAPDQYMKSLIDEFETDPNVIYESSDEHFLYFIKRWIIDKPTHPKRLEFLAKI